MELPSLIVPAGRAYRADRFTCILPAPEDRDHLRTLKQDPGPFGHGVQVDQGELDLVAPG